MKRSLFLNIRNHRIFQTFVVFAIILSALLVGASTYNIPIQIFFILHFLDALITVFFVIEISIRFFAEEKRFSDLYPKKFLNDVLKQW